MEAFLCFNISSTLRFNAFSLLWLRVFHDSYYPHAILILELQENVDAWDGKRQQSLVKSDTMNLPPRSPHTGISPPPSAPNGVISSPPFPVPRLPWKQSTMLSRLLTQMLCMAEKERPEFPRAIQEVSGKGGVEGRTQRDVGKMKGFWQRNTVPMLVWPNNQNAIQMEIRVVALGLSVQIYVRELLSQQNPTSSHLIHSSSLPALRAAWRWGVAVLHAVTQWPKLLSPNLITLHISKGEEERSGEEHVGRFYRPAPGMACSLPVFIFSQLHWGVFYLS